MNVIEFLSTLAKKDIRLWLEGENLRFSAPEGVFTGELRNEVVKRKADIIAFLKQAQKLSDAPIARADRTQDLVLSFGQRRMWILAQLNPNDVTYNMASALALKGPVRLDLLEKTFATIVQRHESLRTRFVEKDGVTSQVIDDFNGWTLNTEDLSALASDAQDNAVQQALDREVLNPFNLAVGPLFRVQVLKRAAEDHVLIVGMHHIVSDGWSMDVLVKELITLYVSFAAGLASPLPALTVQYADFAAWQHQWMASDGLKKQLDYWHQTLANAPAVLALPTDRPRQQNPRNHGAVLQHAITGNVGGAVQSFCQRHELTPFMLFLGTWQLLLGRYAHTDDVIVGSPIAGRSRAEFEDIIGFFVNLLLMRADLSGNPSVRDYFARIRTQALGAFSHQDVPIDYLLETLNVERQPGYPPVAQVAFQLLNVDGNNAALQGPIRVEPMPLKHVAARMDMLLAVAKNDDNYSLSIEYNTDLFNASTIALVAEQFEYLLTQVLASDEQSIGNLTLVSRASLHAHLALPEHEVALAPLNGNQRSMLLDELAHAGTHQNNYGIYCELPLSVDVTLLQQVLDSVVASHAALRTRIVPCTLPGTDEYWLAIHANEKHALQLHDIRQQGGHWLEHVEKLMHRAQPVIHTPLVHFHLVKTGTDRHVLVLGCHHIVLDGASTYLLMQDVLNRYEKRQLAVLRDDATIAFKERALKEQAYNEQDKLLCDSPAVIEFWQRTLHGIEPLDFSKPTMAFKAQPVSVFNDRRIEHTLDGETVATLRGWCQQQQLTPAMFFKGVYALLLKEYCRAEEDFAFFEFQANRSAELQQSIGCYYQQSPVVLRKQAWNNGGDVGEIFTQLKQLRDGAKAYRRFSLAEQSHWVPRARAVFMYNYYNFVSNAQVGGVTVQPQMSAPKVDKGVQFIVRDEGGLITLELRYDVDVFDDMDFVQRFVSVALQIATGVDRVSRLSYVLSDEAHWLREQNETRQALPPYDSVVEWFEQQAQNSPEAIAVQHGPRSLSYSQLNARANQLARYLVAQKIGAGARVALCLDRGMELVTAVWAVLKTGASYVPVDPAYPLDRIDHILKDCNASRVITVSSLRERLPQSTCELVVLDALSFDAFERGDLTEKPAASSEIYVIYTSGSTGLPKGAAVTHRGEVNLQLWYHQALGATALDRPILISAVGFDLTQKNLFAPLLKGGAIVIPEMDFYDDEAILDTIEKHKASWINCAPSAFYPLVEADRSRHFARLASIRFAVLGGEPIRLSALYDWLASPGSQGRIMNSYGPTECTDVVAWHVLDEVDQGTHLFPIGKPVPNMQLHVVNDALQPLPPGLVGEIVVTGIAVGLGYLNREELNSQVFLANPFGGGKLYRTGDLGRYLPDGNLEYLGRKDFQIKLRGLRIELGEIETSLKALATVSDSLVIVRNDQLIAYVLSDGGVTPDGWREALRSRLPEYMVPAALVALQTWPLTPNGKIDRKALPDPQEHGAHGTEKIAPRTPIEGEIAAIWAEFLGKESIGVLDNLFELGGNSITATRIASRLRKFYNTNISVRDVFRAANIAELAVIVERAQLNENVPPITPVPRGDLLPLSFAQQRLWMLDQFDPGLPAYNMPGAFRMHGHLDVGALHKALQNIVNRHEILRSTLVVDNDSPWLRFAPENQWKAEFLDLSAWQEDDREAEIQRRITNELSFRFDLYRGPLLRVTIITCSDNEHVMISNMHHVVSDGWSNGIFIHELSQGYDAFRLGVAPALAPLPIQYADYATWQRTWLNDVELEKQLSHWRSVLTGVAPLRLPVDFQRKRDAVAAGASLAFAVPARDYQQLLKFCQREGVTLYMALLSAYMVVLARYAHQNDITVGTPIANRNNEAVEGLIGFFVNTLVIRGQLRASDSFADFVQAIRAQTLGAYAHQDVPFERLVDALVEQRNLYRSALFQTMFALQNVPMDQSISLPDVQVEPMAVQAAQAKFELSLSMLEWQGELRGELEYRTDLFLPATIEQLSREFVSVLDRVMNDPDTPLHALLSVDMASTGWSFVAESWMWEQDSLGTAQQALQAQADVLAAAITEGKPLLILAEDDAPAARHEVGEIYIPAEFCNALPSMRTVTAYDADWVSTGLHGHCNAFMQVVLSCADLMPMPRAEIVAGEGGDDTYAGALQSQVASVWASVLGVNRVRANDDFFRLGGHSLLATRVVSQLRKALGISIPIRILFEHSRLNDFVIALEQLQGAMSEAKMPPLLPVPREGKLPLSFTQQQLWLLDLLDPGNPAYNMPFALRIEGDLDITAFNQAFTTIIERHEVLRCNFREEGGLPYVVVQPAAPWKFAALDLTHQSLTENDSQLPALAREACEARFDITKDLLIRGQLVKLGQDANGAPHFAILGAIHHLVSDGWSLNLITHELATLYKAYREKTAALLAPLPIQYIDFAHWQRQWLQGEELDRQVAYWKGKLDNDYQVLDLPTDFPRPAIATSRGESFTVTLPTELKSLVQTTASQYNATPFMVLLSGLYVALHRFSGQAGINIGTPIAGRNLTETEALVGFFINTVIMSVELGDNPAIGELLERVKRTALDAYAHQALSFEKIVEVLKPKRDPSRSPLFQVFFNLLNLPDPTEVSGIKVDNLAQDDNESHAKYDINIYAKEFSDRIDLLVVFNPDLYRKESIANIVDAMVASLRAFEGATTKLLDIPLLDAGIAAVDPTETLLVQPGYNPLARLQTLADEIPDKTAIVDVVSNFSYAQFWQNVQATAHAIANKGVREGDVVAIYAPRSAQLPLAIFAVLQAGGVFTVLDPAYPAERLAKACSLAKPALVLFGEGMTAPDVLQSAFAGARAGQLTLSAKPLTNAVIEGSALPAFDPERTAYIAFTSGTTGEPKGIKGCFTPVAHFIEWHVRNVGIGADDIVSMLSGLAHDPLLRDIFTPLFAGATLAIPAAVDLLEPQRLLGWFQEQRISLAHMTPNLWQMFMQAAEEFTLPNLRSVCFGGDRLASPVIASVTRANPHARIFNFYGATETPQAMGCIEATPAVLSCSTDGVSIPVGRGIEGVQLLVVNPAGQLCHGGEVGEIWIRTPYLTQGYLRDEDTSERFITNPFTRNVDDRIYRTGDKGRYLANGQVEFLGRIDQQVKVRGYRVEPAEIQTRLQIHSDVAAAVVVGVNENNDTRLVAYVVPSAKVSGELNVNALRQHLRSVLPEYMVPAAIVSIPQIPLTPNGKLNRAQLPDYHAAIEGRELVAPRNQTEQDILAIWQSVLKHEHISVTDQFFDVGGHSLLATQVVARVKEKFSVEFSLKNIFEVSSVEGMARYVDTALWARQAASAPAAAEGSDDDMEEIEI